MKFSSSLKVIFFLSLAANVFLVGYLIGDRSKGFMKHSMHGRYMMKEMMQGLSPESRAKVKPILRDSKHTLKSNMKQIHSHRQKIAEILVQEPLDTQMLKAQFDSIQHLSGTNIAQSQQAMYQALITLSLSERQAVAEHLKQPPRRRHRPHH